MTEHKSALSYKAFMVRLWQDDEDAPWRASVQTVRTGDVIHFATVFGLVSFLRDQATTRHVDAMPEAGEDDTQGT